MSLSSGDVALTIAVLHVQSQGAADAAVRDRWCRSTVCRDSSHVAGGAWSYSRLDHQRAGRDTPRCSCRSRRTPSRAAATANSVEIRASKPRPATAIAKVF